MNTGDWYEYPVEWYLEYFICGGGWMSDNPLTACFQMFLSLSQPNFMDILYYSVISHTEKYTETRTSAGTHSLFYYCLSVCLFFLSACLSLSLCSIQWSNLASLLLYIGISMWFESYQKLIREKDRATQKINLLIFLVWPETSLLTQCKYEGE